MKTNERLYLDVHVLQTVPPSCVNRDDTGSPKSAVYGGANRARVSSQSWKRAMRVMFEEIMPQDSLGKRTKRIVSMVENEIQKLGGIENTEEAAINILTAAGLKIKSAKASEEGTDALFSMSVDQAQALAKLALEDPNTIKSRPSAEAKKKAKQTLKESPGTENALLPQCSLRERTKQVVSMVEEEIKKLGGIENTEKAATNILTAAGLKIKSEEVSAKASEEGTGALFFMSVAQAKALAKLATEDTDTIKSTPPAEAEKKAKKALKESPGTEIALFGRMVADDPSLNTDACAQVAHSISTHKVSREYDYFTAVDDLSPEDNAGAGHIGTVEFNSATLYRYATVAVHELHRYLEEETAEAVTAFLKAFVCSMPTGKQNTFANRTLPDAVLVTLRKDQPINLAGAFERPVQAGKNHDKGYVEASAQALVKHANNVYENWLGSPVLSLVTGESLKELGETKPLQVVLDTLKEELQERLRTGGDEQ